MHTPTNQKLPHPSGCTIALSNGFRLRCLFAARIEGTLGSPPTWVPSCCARVPWQARTHRPVCTHLLPFGWGAGTVETGIQKNEHTMTNILSLPPLSFDTLMLPTTKPQSLCTQCSVPNGQMVNLSHARAYTHARARVNRRLEGSCGSTHRLRDQHTRTRTRTRTHAHTHTHTNRQAGRQARQGRSKGSSLLRSRKQ